MSVKAFITGCAGPELLAEERQFLADESPWGLILFQRNCVSSAQIQQLTTEFRAFVGRQDAPVLIDQEGGRVQRLKPPIWPAYPPSQVYGDIYGKDRDAGLRAAHLSGLLIAGDLEPLGITIDCLPVLDVGRPDTHAAIGDRAYGQDADTVTALGGAAAAGLQAGGVLPVMKHIPGHGGGRVDSHFELPVVDDALCELEECDFRPFQALRHLPMAMTGHLIYSAVDGANPSTISPIIVGDIIRRQIGFDGLLMSDDISMQALTGDVASRSAAALSAGCDLVLHCNGDIDEMRQAAAAAPELAGQSAKRADRALAARSRPEAVDFEDLRGEYSELLAKFGILSGRTGV